MTHWVEVLLKVVDGPTSPVIGIVRAAHVETGSRVIYDAHHGVAPSHVGFGLGEVRLLRDGRKTRIESLAGEPRFLSDGEACWVFDAQHDEPIESDLLNTRVHNPGRELIVSRPVEHWVRPGYSRPTRAIESTLFLGRPCWSIELETGRGSQPEVLTVDIETGAILKQDSAQGTAEYSRCAFPTQALPDSTFTWSGPVRAPLDVQAENTARWVERSQRDMEWFRETVSARRMQANVLVDFTPTEVRRDARHPDSFEAEFEKGSGRLWRRRRSDEDWLLPRNWTRHYPTPIRGWSTRDFDWACATGLGADSLTDETLIELQAMLHPGQPVTGVPPLPRAS
ncbi:hypothetical protein E5720_18820 [Rhodococcus sp. PAMC28707]|uniref:hypothetical protein n=1 Tax=unclassified Rhodococcus (in: high G+C Gram-positive bacteria) TaxID=192944 RepID=UPI00109D8607|nr:MULTISPECIES: hypothetical protein [unclassified Rhodococcus (in: high G+C Gram-positive bacteria)]QCB51610.1 hypothetical protein E5769_16705 [Rhodococcus sp. PAMC28705]QCB60222.1 hypothetical protein E5720_18820 [Rhodococcus sp. PAMC28707]